MTIIKTLGLAGHVVWDGVNNNKALLLSGATLSTGIGVLRMGVPEISFNNIYHCFSAMRPALPYINSAIAGAVIAGLGKVLINVLLQEIEKKGNETVRE